MLPCVASAACSALYSVCNSRVQDSPIQHNQALPSSPPHREPAGLEQRLPLRRVCPVHKPAEREPPHIWCAACVQAGLQRQGGRLKREHLLPSVPASTSALHGRRSAALLYLLHWADHSVYTCWAHHSRQNVVMSKMEDTGPMHTCVCAGGSGMEIQFSGLSGTLHRRRLWPGPGTICTILPAKMLLPPQAAAT